MTAESAVTPTVIVALSAHHALSPAVIDSDSKQMFRRKKKGHERPRLMIISASKAENKKKMAQICCLYIKSAGSRESYCLVPSRSPASALPKQSPG